MFFVFGMKRALSKLNNTSHVFIVFHWLFHRNCKDPSIAVRSGVGDELDRSRDGKSTQAQLKAAHFHFNNACIDARQTVRRIWSNSAIEIGSMNTRVCRLWAVPMGLVSPFLFGMLYIVCVCARGSGEGRVGFTDTFCSHAQRRGVLIFYHLPLA